MNTDECCQEKCSHNKNNPNFQGNIKNKLITMCPTCQCGATSNIINKNCERCIRCENFPDYIRGKDPMNGMTIEQIQKVMEQGQIVQVKEQEKIIKEIKNETR